MEIRVGIVVCARVKSSRLHEKVLQKINGKYTIEILLDHIIQDKYPVILAIPESKENDILKEIAIDKGIDVYRGYDDSPLHRLYNCALNNNFNHVVRITADDILIDQFLLRKQIDFHINGNLDYTYMSRCPEGIAGEIIRTDCLEQIMNNEGDKSIEFISYYLKNENYRWKEYYPPFEYQYTFRLTMDYPEDLMLLRILFSNLQEPFGTLDIINFLKQHKYFLRINKLPEISIYTCNYNTGKYITDCMDSVYNQSFQDFEYIIIDDSSTDNSMDIITEYYSNLSYENQQRTKILRNTVNIDLASCSNKALEISRGKYIIRVDSDDKLKEDALEKMLEIIKIDNSEGCVSAFYNVDENLKVLEEIHENKYHAGCSLLSRSCSNDIKFKDGIRFMEGKEFFDRFNRKYKIAFYGEPLWYYRQHPDSKTAQKEHPENG